MVKNCQKSQLLFGVSNNRPLIAKNREKYAKNICQKKTLGPVYSDRLQRGGGGSFGTGTYVKFMVLLENGEIFSQGPTHPLTLDQKYLRTYGKSTIFFDDHPGPLTLNHVFCPETWRLLPTDINFTHMCPYNSILKQLLS